MSPNWTLIWPQLVRYFKQITFTKQMWWKTPLAIALGVSLLIHLIALVVRWTHESEAERRLKTPLAVVLVNANGNIQPLNAKRLAQVDLNGGGESDSSHATALKQANPGIAERLENLQKEQRRLLSSLRSKENNGSTTNLTKQKSDKTDTDPLEAELAKRLNRDGIFPRKAIFTATSAKSVVYAQYYDGMRRKVEKYGTQFFPRADGKPLYGSLVVLVSVNAVGKIIGQPEVKKSSGSAELDRQAVAIVNACAPFGDFPGAMKKQLDIIDWITTFDFVQGGEGTKLEVRDSKKK